LSEKLSFRLRIGAIAALLALLYASELRHWLPAYRLFSFAFAFLLIATIASLLRGKLRDALLVAASLALGLGLLEGAALLIEPQRIVKVSGGLWAPRAELGWGAREPGRYHAERIDPKTGAAIYSADYTIDSNLLRQTKSCETGPAMVFFGCSFTFGDGVNDAETMPQAFADLFDGRQRVLNLGYEGYGPQQVLRALETGAYDALIGPQPAYFVVLTAPWHAERTSCKASFVRDAPRYALEDGRVVYKGACVEGARLWLRRWLEGSALYRVAVEPLCHRLSHDDVELYIQTLLAAVDLARTKYGVRTIVPYMRGEAGYLAGAGFDDDAVMQRLREGGALVVDASLADARMAGAAIEIAGDMHPTPLAHRLRARLLKAFIEKAAPDASMARQESRLQ
jgi:hypothetical protein